MNKTLAAAALLTALTTPAWGKDIKHIDEKLAVDKGQTLSFEVSVGTVEIRTCDCSQVSLKVTVEPSDNHWRLFSSDDVDDAELSVGHHHDGLSFKINKKDTKQKWIVEVPASSPLDIEVGVGEVDISGFDNSLDAEVGVGEVDVELTSRDYRRIKLESGVGDTRISGMKGDVQNERAMVSDSARYRGDGQYDIDVEVGVGDIRVSNKD